jgi:class 3 adenylate cyclase
VTVTLPETRYARNNGLHVAYQLVGDGPVDIVLLTQWFSNIDSQWDVPPLAEPDRVLATILFTDIVGSTRLAAEHCDRAWRELLERHHALVRSELARFRGREVDTAGDGFLAVFDGPGRAVRCASAAVRSVQSLGIEIRAGVHTGEVEVVGEGVRGIAVHIGARVSALASASEVLVSSTVRDLVAGSGLQFEDRGSRELKGVPDPWRVLALIDD